MLLDESEVVEKACNCFSVTYYFLLNHLFQIPAFERTAHNSLILFWPGFAFPQPISEQDKHFFFQKSGCWEEIKKNTESLGSVSGFLDQFSRRCFARTLTVIDTPCHQLPQRLPCCMPVLPDQQHPPIRQNRQHHHRARVCDHFSSGPYSSRLNQFIAPYSKHRTLVNYFASKDFCLFCLARSHGLSAVATDIITETTYRLVLPHIRNWAQNCARSAPRLYLALLP